MYVARIPNRGSPPAILLRESYREGGKVKIRTLANLSHWPEHKVDTLARALKGLPPKLELAEAFEITRSLPHGHVAAVLATAQRLGLAELIDPTPSRRRDLVMAMLIAAVIAPDSKLATARGLRTETATSSLGEVLGVSGCDEDDLYAAMDWALARQERIENTLAARHLTNGMLVLYDVSSAAFEGRHCPLGAIGYARDGVKGRRQIVYGLLCTTAGVPVAIEVFDGNTADPKTLTAQIRKLTTRFGLSRVALVGDRGMLTSARITEELRPAHLDWLSALRADQIKALVAAEALQLSLFDEQNLVAITHPDYPGERLIGCRNPALAAERTRKRGELLAATETELDKITRPPAVSVSRCAARTPSGCGPEGNQHVQDGQALHHHHHRGHVHLLPQRGHHHRRGRPRRHLRAAHQPARRHPDRRQCGAALQGTRRRRAVLPHPQQRARRAAHPPPPRRSGAGHMFLRMLSYYISWHMKQALAPILFYDNDKPGAAAKRANPVAAAQRSDQALTKAARKRTQDGLPVHSFTSLLADLATICANHIQPADDMPAFTMITSPTPLQRQAFDLLGLSHRHGYA